MKQKSQDLIFRYMEKRLRKTIRKSILNLLSEEADSSEDTVDKQKEKTPKKKRSVKGMISTKGAFGSGGRSKRFVSDAGSRAAKDPKGLLQDLGIAKKVSGSDLDQTLKIINMAIHTNSLMSRAYVGAREVSDIAKGENDSRAMVAINLGELDRKNGVRFLAHTLTAAVNAGFLNLQGGLQFGQSSNYDITVYVM